MKYLIGAMAAWLFVFMIFGHPVHSQEKRGDATVSRLLNLEGAQLFKEEKFLAAAQAFERAYNVYPNAKAAFNSGMAYEKLENLEMAVYWYNVFLSFGKESEEERKAVREKIKELEKKIVKEANDKPNDKPKENKTENSGEKENGQKSKDVISADPKYSTISTITESEPEGLPYTTLKWVSASGAISCFMAGMVFNLLALSQAEEANRLSPQVPGYHEKYNQEYDSAETKQKLSYVLYGLAGASALASGIFFYLDGEGDESSSSGFLPLIDKNSATVTFSFVF